MWKQDNNLKRMKGVYYSSCIDFDEKDENDINSHASHIAINQILDYCQ
jgi:hypothetical protein